MDEATPTDGTPCEGDNDTPEVILMKDHCGVPSDPYLYFLAEESTEVIIPYNENNLIRCMKDASKLIWRTDSTLETAQEDEDVRQELNQMHQPKHPQRRISNS